MSSGFADQVHIDRIRDALWGGPVHGRAAVMVGAGFSCNARPISPSAPGFPPWADLTSRLVEALYPEDASRRHDRDDALVRMLSTSGALRLAQEYEAAFSRKALDRLLIGAIPDAAYEPGPLHERLLGLPWSDVFTTYYDTLLERGAARGRGVTHRLTRTPVSLRDPESVRGPFLPMFAPTIGSANWPATGSENG
jgi:hypothetical protein